MAAFGRPGIRVAISSHSEPRVFVGTDSFVKYRTEYQSAVDGNTVNMDVERAAFAENALRYEASVTFISGMIRSMNTALTGQ